VNMSEWEVLKMKIRPPGCAEPGPLRVGLRGGPSFGYRLAQVFSKNARSWGTPGCYSANANYRYVFAG
jgi:hypothetical protein